MQNHSSALLHFSSSIQNFYKQNFLLHRLFCVCLISILGFAGGCTTTTNKSSISSLQPDASGIEVVLMPLDVELYILTASGFLEPQAEWTEVAEKHMLHAIRDYQQTRGVQLILYENPEEFDLDDQKLLDIERLHSAVGRSILIHEYNERAKLPSKKDQFKWTLGPDVSVLRDKYDADYALFVFIRDSYSSGGRVFMQIAAALLGFIGVPGGQQLGFASLVDLRSGDVVWFNRLFSNVGDLRDSDSAAQTVSRLLDGLPE